MAYTKITDHEAQALARLAFQYQPSTNIRALVSAGASGVQTIEDVLWTLYTERLLDSAVGAQLDVLGAIVGQAREAATDDVYRARLRGRVLANRSDNTVETLLAIVRAVLNDPAAVAVFARSQPAAFTITIDDVAIDEDTALVLAGLIRDARSAGVGGSIITSTEPPEDTFAFAGPVGFLSALTAAGAATLTITGDATAFSPTGSLTLDEGTTEQEVVAYTARAGSTFTLDGVTSYDHPAGTSAVPEPDTDGDGFGDDTTPGVGGVLAGVYEA